MAFPSFKIKTANMAGALPNIGCHISEKGSIREKMWVFFYLGAYQVAQSPQARLGLAGSHGF